MATPARTKLPKPPWLVILDGPESRIVGVDGQKLSLVKAKEIFAPLRLFECASQMSRQTHMPGKSMKSPQKQVPAPVVTQTMLDAARTTLVSGIDPRLDEDERREFLTQVYAAMHAARPQKSIRRKKHEVK